MFGDWFGNSYFGQWFGGGGEAPPAPPPVVHDVGYAIRIPVDRLAALALQRDDELVLFVVAAAAALKLLD